MGTAKETIRSRGVSRLQRTWRGQQEPIAVWGRGTAGPGCINPGDEAGNHWFNTHVSLIAKINAMTRVEMDEQVVQEIEKLKRTELIESDQRQVFFERRGVEPVNYETDLIHSYKCVALLERVDRVRFSALLSRCEVARGSKSEAACESLHPSPFLLRLAGGGDSAAAAFCDASIIF